MVAVILKGGRRIILITGNPCLVGLQLCAHGVLPTGGLILDNVPMRHDLLLQMELYLINARIPCLETQASVLLPAQLSLASQRE